MKKNILLGLILLFSYTLHAQSIQTLVPFGAEWKYNDRGVNLKNDWRLPSFDDLLWKSGDGKLGYGMTGIKTVIQSGPAGKRIITSYFRKTINLSSSGTNYKMRVKRDDGIVVYINNKLAYKNNLPDGEITFLTSALKDITTDTSSIEVALPDNIFAIGANTISVEIHQSRRTSPDLLFDLELTANTITVTPPGTNCGAPLSTTATSISQNAATINWNAVQGASAYELQWRNSSTNSWTTISNASSPYTITGLSAGQVVVARIRSICNNIPGNYSAEVWFITKGAGTTCLTPPNVNSTNITATGATINWGAVGGAVSYTLQWKLSSASSWTTISNLNTTTYSISGLTANTSYDVQIQAVCSNGSGSFSVPVSFTTQTAGVSCGVPTNLNAASINQTSANLTWAAVTGATSYTLQWRTVGSSSWTTIANLTATSYSLSGLIAGTNYEFQVRAVCGNTQGNYATPFSFSTAVPGTCGNPANLTLGVVAQTTAELRWGAVGGAVSYNLEWQTAASSTWSLISNITTNSYTLTGLTAGTAYNFRVQAVCSGATSAFSQTKDFNTTNPSVTCNAPTGLSAGNLLQTSAILSWSPVTGATAYNLEWKSTASSNWTTVANISTNSYTLTGLSPNTSYEFIVQSICSGGTTSTFATPPASFTTTGSTCGVTSLSTTSITQNTATLGWTPVQFATGYNLQWKPVSATSWTTVSNLPTNPTSYNLTGLTADTDYEFRVQTICSSGSTGVYTSATTFRTLPNTPTGTANEVIYIWSGALQSTSAVVTAKLTSASTNNRLVVSTSQNLSNPIYSSVVPVSATTNMMVRLPITGLAPNTTYYYAVESNGIIDNSPEDMGKFKTPEQCGFSFKFTTGSCSRTGNHQVYTAMTNHDPLFTLITGDFHYADPNSTNVSSHRSPYETSILSQAPSATHFRNVPIAYTWDDHDYCGNNSGGAMTGRANARRAYQEYIPHYPLAAGSGNQPIQQAFTIGRLHFILADTRSERASGTMLGAAQNAWFKQQCLFARDNNLMIVFVSGVLWHGDVADNWEGYFQERDALANWFRDNNIKNMFILTGDAHMLGIDDGGNQDFSTGTNNPNKYPHFCSSGLNVGNNPCVAVWNTWCTGNVSGSGQYALIDVTDNGGTDVTIKFSAYRTNGNNATNPALLRTWSFTRTLGTQICNPPAITCGIPTNLAAASISQTGATLNWSAVTGSTAYNLQWKTAAATTWTTVSNLTATSYNLTGLIASTQYNFQVQAVCGNTTGTYSAPINFTTTTAQATCGTPGGLSATAITATGATLNWIAVNGATSYNLQWKTAAATTWTTVSNLTATSYNLTGLAASTQYNFQVQTVCSNTSGTYSSASNFTTTSAPVSCGSPSGLTSANITQTSAALSWTAVSGATSYNLQWKTAAATTWTTVSNLTATSYNLTGLAASTQYNFQVQAVCGNTTGNYSSASNFTTTLGTVSCGIPSGLTSANITQTSAALSWTAVSGATSYNLQWKTAAATTWTTVSNLTATSYNLTGLAASTQYNFQVQAVCGNTSGTYSSASNFTTTSTPVNCGTPSGLTSANITQTSVALSWTAVSGATSYNLQWKTAAAATWTTVSSLTTTTYNLTGLTAATPYTFQVQAVCGNTTGSYSAASNFTTTSAPVSCGTPSGLTSANITQTSAALSWTAVSGATSYNLQWKTAAAVTWTTVSSLTTTTYNLTGLTAATPYTFQVQAVCGNTTGSYSAASNFTTTSAPTGPANEVVYMWSGALQPTSATVVAKMTTASTTCRAVVSTSQTLTNPIYSSFASAATTNNLMAKMNITGLTPNTVYYYAIESNGIVDNSADDIGRFQTSGTGAYSFKFTVGSCSKTGNHSVYTLMANKNPLFFLSPGDLHYADPNSTNVNTHRIPYETFILSPTPSRNFFKNHGIAYTWDDHDYCGNNNTVGQQTGTQSARQAYQEYIPHYPLASGTGNVPINQAFTIGRVHFIMPDLRSTRAQSSGTMFGTATLAWFKEQCLYARNNNLMIAWVTGTSFGGVNTDNWGGYTSERTSLSNWFRDNNIKNMFIMSGDAHMLAIDNGTNHDFSTGSNNPNDYPVFAAAAINNAGSTKGGTYSQGGTFPNPGSSNGQYGLVEVTDNGGCTITIKFTGYRNGSATATTETQVNTYTFTRTLCTVPGRQGTLMDVSLRALENGTKVQATWNSYVSGESYILERSSDKRKYKQLTKSELQTGSFIDESPETGWNFYRVKNSRGVVLEQKEIFIAGKSKIKLVPNPAKANVMVEIKAISTDAPDSRYIVYNTLMKTVLTGNVALHKGDNKLPLDISGLTQGTYLVHIVVNGVELVEKLVVE